MVVMDIVNVAALVLLSTHFASASFSNISQGCNLIIPEEVRLSIEPLGEPLLIHVDMRVIAIREVNDNDDGGSFGLDIG